EGATLFGWVSDWDMKARTWSDYYLGCTIYGGSDNSCCRSCRAQSRRWGWRRGIYLQRLSWSSWLSRLDVLNRLDWLQGLNRASGLTWLACDRVIRKRHCLHTPVSGLTS